MMWVLAFAEKHNVSPDTVQRWYREGKVDVAE